MEASVTFLKLVIITTFVNKVYSQGRITGGKEVEPHSVPFQIALFYDDDKGHRFCGGVVYDEVNVVTAAHCCYGYGHRVYGGLHSVNKFGSTVQEIVVDKMIIHENFYFETHKNDICMLHLKDPFEFNEYVQPAHFPGQDEEIKPYATGFATGWGQTKSRSNSDVLLGVSVPILPSIRCVSAYENHYIPHDPATMVCAGDVGGKGICFGDSGGPLTVNKVVVGLSSWGPTQCGVLPANFVRVPKYINWLEKNKKVIWLNTVI